MSCFSELILVGSGGFATEIADYLLQSEAEGSPRIAGVVDDFAKTPVDVCGLPFLGKLTDITPRDNLGFVITSGTPRFRSETAAQVLQMGGQLATVIHSSAYIARDAEISAGCIICPFAIVNSGAQLGECVVLNVHSSVGHAASVGDFSVLSPYAAMNGWAGSGKLCFLGTRATIFPRVQIGDRCTIDSHSFVKASIGDRMIVSVRGQYNVIVNRLER